MIKKILFSNIFYLSLIFAAICVEVYFSYLFHQASYDLSDIDNNFQQANLKNKELRSEIAKYSSLSWVAKRAKDNGFVEATEIFYLPQNDVVAQKTK